MTTPPSTIQGDLVFPREWTVFCHPEHGAYGLDRHACMAAAKARREVALQQELPDSITSALPATLTIDGRTMQARTVTAVNGQVNFRDLLGSSSGKGLAVHTRDYQACGQTAWVFVPLRAVAAGEVTLGFGADSSSRVWLNGTLLLNTDDIVKVGWPPSLHHHQVTVSLPAGDSLLAVRFISGLGSSILAVGGPRELRAAPPHSLLSDPLLYQDPEWGDERLTALPGGKPCVDIGSRRELLIDDFLFDALTGQAELRLHPAQPREIVMQLDQPWEGPVACFFTILADGDMYRLYYRGHPESGEEVTCLAESTDGIHFQRRHLDRYAIDGSTDNNIVYRGGRSGHNFAPFLDTNPSAPSDQRYKAIAYHPDGGSLAAYASPDGLTWRQLRQEPVITQGAFDSHNLAYWDAHRGCYVCYYRECETTGPHQGVRGIMTTTSPDFLNWSEPAFLTYTDERPQELYTNALLAYPRAPHITLGTPARFVPYRTKIPAHPYESISDAIFMSSRDGCHFHRWLEGFVRPGTEPEVWTDRNNYPAWGMIQTSPEELSLYWTEHYRHPGMRLRRGVIRTDGFASLHAGSRVGELLTRPLTMAGGQLEINYATSAIGAIRIAICDESGAPLEGFDLIDSEVIYGNEIAHIVNWHGCTSLEELAGRPIRLRIRLQDADLYALRFGA